MEALKLSNVTLTFRAMQAEIGPVSVSEGSLGNLEGRKEPELVAVLKTKK